MLLYAHSDCAVSTGSLTSLSAPGQSARGRGGGRCRAQAHGAPLHPAPRPLRFAGPAMYHPMARAFCTSISFLFRWAWWSTASSAPSRARSWSSAGRAASRCSTADGWHAPHAPMGQMIYLDSEGEYTGRGAAEAFCDDRRSTRLASGVSDELGLARDSRLDVELQVQQGVPGERLRAGVGTGQHAEW